MPASAMETGRLGKANGYTPSMNVAEESDPGIVPMNQPNKTELQMAVEEYEQDAEPVSQLRPSGYVDDFAHVLDRNTIAQMSDICGQIDQKANAQIAVVTINSCASGNGGFSGAFPTASLAQ